MAANTEQMKKQIITELIVNLETLMTHRDTETMEDIISKIEQTGLKIFLEAEPKFFYPEALVEFYINLTFDKEANTLKSSVQNHAVEISKTTLTKLLGLQDVGADVKNYRVGEEAEVWHQICKEGEESSFKMTASKGLLQKDYQIVLDMVSKLIMCNVGSHNQLSSPKFHMLAAILDGAKINWCDYIFERLKKEQEKVKITNDIFERNLGYGKILSFLLEKLIVDLQGGEEIHEYKRMGKKDFAEIQKEAYKKRKGMSAGEAQPSKKKKKKAQPKKLQTERRLIDESTDVEEDISVARASAAVAERTQAAEERSTAEMGVSAEGETATREISAEGEQATAEETLAVTEEEEEQEDESSDEPMAEHRTKRAHDQHEPTTLPPSDSDNYESEKAMYLKWLHWRISPAEVLKAVADEEGWDQFFTLENWVLEWMQPADIHEATGSEFWDKVVDRKRAEIRKSSSRSEESNDSSDNGDDDDSSGGHGGAEHDAYGSSDSSRKSQDEESHMETEEESSLHHKQVAAEDSTESLEQITALVDSIILESIIDSEIMLQRAAEEAVWIDMDEQARAYTEPSAHIQGARSPFAEAPTPESSAVEPITAEGEVLAAEGEPLAAEGEALAAETTAAEIHTSADPHTTDSGAEHLTLGMDALLSGINALHHNNNVIDNRVQALSVALGARYTADEIQRKDLEERLQQAVERMLKEVHDQFKPVANTLQDMTSAWNSRNHAVDEYMKQNLEAKLTAAEVQMSTMQQEIVDIKGHMTSEIANVKKQLAIFQDHQQQRHEEMVELITNLQANLTHSDDGKKGEKGKKRRKLILTEEAAVQGSADLPPPRRTAAAAAQSSSQAAERPQISAGEKGKGKAAAQQPSLSAPPQKDKGKKVVIPKQVKTPVILNIAEITDKISSTDREILEQARQEFRPLYYIDASFGDHLNPDRAFTQYLYMNHNATWGRMQRILQRHRSDYLQAPPPPTPKQPPRTSTGEIDSTSIDLEINRIAVDRDIRRDEARRIVLRTYGMEPVHFISGVPESSSSEEEAATEEQAPTAAEEGSAVAEGSRAAPEAFIDAATALGEFTYMARIEALVEDGWDRIKAKESIDERFCLRGPAAVEFRTRRTQLRGAQLRSAHIPRGTRSYARRRRG